MTLRSGQLTIKASPLHTATLQTIKGTQFAQSKTDSKEQARMGLPT